MLPLEIIQLRLSNQLLLEKKCKTPGEVVKHMCAMQAQDYLGALWAVALRTGSAFEGDVEKAITAKEIVRTWPMRGTLHFVAPEDAKWMLTLMTPRILANQVKRFKREFDLDETGLRQCEEVLVRELEGGKILTRSDVYRVLEDNGIPATGQRGLHIIWHLAQKAILCFGPRIGKQPSFTLFDEWIPQSRNLTYEESLAEIALRYFSGRGPALPDDFVWWTGLPRTAAKAAIELAKPNLASISYNEKTYWMAPDATPSALPENHYLLLPAFDEYLIAYADRSLMLGNYTLKHVVPFSNGMFSPVIVENGMVIGTWKRTLQKEAVQIEYKGFSPIVSKQEKELRRAAEAYEKFLGN